MAAFSSGSETHDPVVHPYPHANCQLILKLPVPHGKRHCLVYFSQHSIKLTLFCDLHLALLIAADGGSVSCYGPLDSSFDKRISAVLERMRHLPYTRQVLQC